MIGGRGSSGNRSVASNRRAPPRRQPQQPRRVSSRASRRAARASVEPQGTTVQRCCWRSFYTWAWGFMRIDPLSPPLHHLLPVTLVMALPALALSRWASVAFWTRKPRRRSFAAMADSLQFHRRSPRLTSRLRPFPLSPSF